MGEFSTFPLWDPDPVMWRHGAFELRYYSACYFMVFATGYVLWHWQMRRAGHALEPVSRIVLWAAAGVFVGGRLGHCLLYEPDYYLSRPLEILDLRRGGTSSHGAIAGLILTLFLYARRYEYSTLEVWDRFSPAAALGAVWIRVGNFFNAEIVGREWTGPWAIRFGPYARELQRIWEADHGPLGWVARPLPRHPAQLYEAAGYLGVLLAILAVDRALGERRPRGLLMGMLGTLLLGFRFAVEYWKEFQRFGALAPDPVQQVIRVVPETGLTMGQWLSIPVFLLGLAIGIGSLRRRLPAALPSRFDVEPEDA